MGICYSMSHSQCDMCEKSLSVDHNRNILYKFQGCGKYHNKKSVIYVSWINSVI